MADNVAITAGTGTTIAADDIGGALHQRIKLTWGVDGSAVDASASNPLPVVQTGTPGLATGAATSANQATQITALADILAKLSADPATQTTLAAILAKIIAAPATEAKQDALNALITSIDAKNPALGQALAAASVPVVLTAAQLTTLTPPAAITGFATSAKQDTQITAEQAILAKLIAAPATEAKQDTQITAEQAILAKLIAAPATEAKQDTGNTSLASIDSKLTTQAGYLDGVETLLTAVDGHVDGIEAEIGATNESAASTDIATSGLNGLTKRLLQRITTLLAVFPTTIDTNSGNKSASTLRTVIATDQPNLTTPLNVAASFAASESHLGEMGGNLTMISTQFTRPSDTTAYAAGDAVGDSTSALTMQALANAARVSGGSGYITGIRINTDKKSITPRFRIHLYNTNGATLSNDNAAWQDRYADNSKYVGCWDLPAMRTGADSTNSTNSYSEDMSVRIPFTCAATSLYYVLETLDAFTPASAQGVSVSVFADRN